MDVFNANFYADNLLNGMILFLRTHVLVDRMYRKIVLKR